MVFNGNGDIRFLSRRNMRLKQLGKFLYLGLEFNSLEPFAPASAAYQHLGAKILRDFHFLLQSKGAKVIAGDAAKPCSMLLQ